MQKFIIPYRSHLGPYAKTLRRNMTLAEILLWQQIKARKMEGARFRRQVPAGPYITDFLCKELMLAIEVDGSSHQDRFDLDLERDKKLASMGITVLRFWDYDVKNDIERILEQIRSWIRNHPPRPDGHPSDGGRTHPGLTATPPMEGT
jgi:very-short-patch-repair endonuclease